MRPSRGITLLAAPLVFASCGGVFTARDEIEQAEAKVESITEMRLRFRADSFDAAHGAPPITSWPNIAQGSFTTLPLNGGGTSFETTYNGTAFAHVLFGNDDYRITSPGIENAIPGATLYFVGFFGAGTQSVAFALSGGVPGGSYASCQGTNSWLKLEREVSGKVIAGIAEDGGTSYFASAGSTTTAVTAHEVRWDKNEAKLYDAVAGETDYQSASGPTGDIDLSGSLYLGNCDGGHYFDGGIAEVLFWPRALTVAERAVVRHYIELRYGQTF